jgi:hypothetical protein
MAAKCVTLSGNENSKTRCLSLALKGAAVVTHGAVQAEAAGFFVFAANAGGRIAWLRSRPGVCGMARDYGSRSAQIGADGTPPAACVGQIERCNAGLRRLKDRACWRPCLQQYGHLAGQRKNWALSPFDNPVLPVGPMGGTRPIDAATIQTLPSAGPNTGRRRKVLV